MMPFKACPSCAGDLVQKKVEKLLRGGKHTAVIRVLAEVCSLCGERLYPLETIRQFEKIRKKLEREDTRSFQLLGQSYKVE